MSKERRYEVKRALSSLDLAVIIKELLNLVLDAHVDNVYEDVDGSLVLKLRTSSEDIYLLIKPGERMNVARHIAKLSSGGRVALFRRFANGLRITNIGQLEFERVCRITLRGKDDHYYMYVEIIPRGILALTDSDNKVLAVSRELNVRDRSVIIGRQYMLPPMFKDFRSLGVSEWFNTIKTYDDVVRGLIKGLGIPPEVVNEVIKEDLLARDLTEELIAELRSRVLHFIANVIDRPQPVILADDSGKFLSFLSFKPSKVGDGLRLIEFSSLNEAVEEYFLAYSKLIDMQRKSREINEELSKVDKLINNLRSELDRAKEELNKVLEIYELTINNYNILDEVHNCVWNTVKKYGWEDVSKCGVIDYDKNSGTFKVLVNGRHVVLNIREDVKDYVIRLKTEISGYEDKIRRIEEVIKEALSRKDVLIKEKEAEAVPPLLRRIDWYDKYHWIITSEGFLALGGRDAEQNEKLVRRYLNDNDVFMHADIKGASVFIIKCGGIIPSSGLREVSTLAACYSRAWREGLGSIDVFWVLGNQVSKRPPAGEYIGLGSFMVYGKKNFIKDVKLELAIGISIINDKYYKVIVGPEEYIKGRAKFYVVLNPGNVSKEAIGKKMLNFFVECDKRLKYLDVNELTLRIPGPSEILRYVNNI